MAKLSPVREFFPLLSDLKLLHRGKVRDTYELGLGNLLVVTTDAISIFDFVLNAMIPEKGYILNAMSHFWFKYLEQDGIRTHMVAAGEGIDPYLPAPLRGDTDLQRRAMVVRKLQMIPIEFIARNCLTGSVLTEYRKTGSVYGKKLREGLEDGDRLPDVLFTPTDKAEDGHDMPIDPKDVRNKYPSETIQFISAFAKVTDYAKGRGILMADGKGEIGRDKNGMIRIGDEFGTADSSRFWDFAAWEASRNGTSRKAPAPYDKQKVRAWGIEQGINKLDPKKIADVELVHAMQVPGDLILETTKIYRCIFWRLTGKTLEAYTRDELEVMAPDKKRKIAVVAGSTSDMPAVSKVMARLMSEHYDLFTNGTVTITTAVISCHRNPQELNAFADSGCDGADVAICVGSMAFALPGVLDALLYAKGRKVPVIGVALGEKGTPEHTAAVLSIEQLPGTPVLLCEDSGRAYTGTDGLLHALRRACSTELPPVKERVHKPALLGLDLKAYQKS